VDQPTATALHTADQAEQLIISAIERIPDVVADVANRLFSVQGGMPMRDLSEADWAVIRSFAMYGWAAFSVKHMTEEDENDS
jgi:hypothetical protein